MRLAVTTTWRNTGITAQDIGQVYYRQPCLVCILAKRNKDSKLIWSRRPPAQPPPDQPPPQPPDSSPPTQPPYTTDSKPPVPLLPTTPRDITDSKPTTIPEPDTSKAAPITTIADDLKDDSLWEIGECISYDNVGPISPETAEG